jgi:hypothetical protein
MLILSKKVDKKERMSIWDNDLTIQVQRLADKTEELIDVIQSLIILLQEQRQLSINEHESNRDFKGCNYSR